MREEMSSWIPSLFNPNSDPSSDEDGNPTSSSPNKAPETHFSGVKNDLSAVFRGVAAFLAPPPATSVSGASSSSSDAIAGIKNDLAEIQGSFKSGISLISSKFSNNFLHLPGEFDDDDDGDEVEEEDDDDDDNDAVGITEEVVDFARKLSKRPELWIDFPLSLADDFHLSDYQREHAANVDYLVPELMKLRQKIASQISDGKFWIIYFILLFPRFNEADLELLSTPQVVEARETLLKKLQTKSDTVQDTSEINKDGVNEYVAEGDESTSLHKDASSKIVSSKKSADNMESKNSISEEEDDDDSHASVDAQKQSEKEEDISFSDLEDDDNDLSEKLPGNRVLNNKRGDSGEWIQLHENTGAQGGEKKIDKTTSRDKESEGEDSSDWLAVDDSDFDNLDAV